MSKFREVFLYVIGPSMMALGLLILVVSAFQGFDALQAEEGPPFVTCVPESEREARDSGTPQVCVSVGESSTCIVAHIDYMHADCEVHCYEGFSLRGEDGAKHLQERRWSFPDPCGAGDGGQDPRGGDLGLPGGRGHQRPEDAPEADRGVVDG